MVTASINTTENSNAANNYFLVILKMYFIDNKLCLICIIVITTNSYFINSSTLNTIFISGSDLDLTTFLTMETEACNIKGCFYPRKFYFVEDPFIICPTGFDLKLAYKDQEGHYRVGSLNTKQSKKKILENCTNNPKKSAAPNYLKSTASTEAKMRNKFTAVLHTSTQLPRLIIIQKEEEYLATTNENILTSNFPNSILTDDLSEISDESFRTAQVSLEDSLYVKHSFPQNMFDDKGDIIYGTGLLGLLFSFICTLIKLIIEKQKNKEHSDLPQHLPKTSTLIAHPGSNNRNQYSVLNNQNYMLPTSHSTAIVSSETNNQHHLTTHAPHASNSTAFVSNETNNQHYHTALPQPPTASQLAVLTSNDTNTQHSRVLITSQAPAYVSNVIAQQFALGNLRPNCDCPTGCCTKGQCHCYRARRACGPTCHGGNGTSTNCKATLEHAARVYNQLIG